MSECTFSNTSVGARYFFWPTRFQACGKYSTAVVHTGTTTLRFRPAIEAPTCIERAAASNHSAVARFHAWDRPSASTSYAQPATESIAYPASQGTPQRHVDAPGLEGQQVRSDLGPGPQGGDRAVPVAGPGAGHQPRGAHRTPAPRACGGLHPPDSAPGPPSGQAALSRPAGRSTSTTRVATRGARGDPGTRRRWSARTPASGS